MQQEEEAKANVQVRTEDLRKSLMRQIWTTLDASHFHKPNFM